ncbi:hypothetical protein NL676_035270 [Syzygium grande]|nr:hypothetical protein NL676_035270 [Syzygium grande]
MVHWRDGLHDIVLEHIDLDSPEPRKRSYADCKNNGMSFLKIGNHELSGTHPFGQPKDPRKTSQLHFCEPHCPPIRAPEDSRNTDGIAIAASSHIQGGSGYVRDIHIENITIFYVHNPIIIDEGYCDDQKRHCKMTLSIVNVSNMTYRKVRGTSRNELSFTLRCTGGTSCTNIMIEHIDLDSLELGKRSYADCKNIINASFRFVNPPISCLTS